MNYSRIYKDLVERAQLRNRLIDCEYEGHHIIPKCIGGTNEKSNIVYLTVEEHFVAHRLLSKMYKEVKGLRYAVILMAIRTPAKNRKQFAYIKSLNKELLCTMKGKVKGPMPQDTRDKISKAKTGVKAKPFTDQHRANISKATKGKRVPPVSDETRRKLSESHKGISHGPRSEETKRKLSEALKGKPTGPRSSETKAKMSAALKGRVISESHRQKLSAANLGKKHCQETLDKISAIHKGIPKTAEHKSKVSAAKTGTKKIEVEPGVFKMIRPENLHLYQAK